MANRFDTRSLASKDSELVRAAKPEGKWKPVTDALVRAHSGYTAPAGYRYATAASADLDRDGRADRVDFLDDGRNGAIRIRFGNGTTRLVMQGKRRIWGEGLFAAGPHAVMINYPESSIVFLHMTGREIRAVFVGE